MSDGSMPRCGDCGRVAYDCISHEGKCFSCGCKLDKEEIEAGRDQRFDCYCIKQGLRRCADRRKQYRRSSVCRPLRKY
jgi:hypothetical protein